MLPFDGGAGGKNYIRGGGHIRFPAGQVVEVGKPVSDSTRPPLIVIDDDGRYCVTMDLAKRILIFSSDVLYSHSSFTGAEEQRNRNRQDGRADD